MKHKIFSKLIIVLLVVIMMFSLCSATVSAAAAASSTGKKETKPPKETYTSVLAEIRKYIKPEEKHFWRDGIKELKKIQSYDRLGSDFVNNLSKLLEDPANADYTELAMKTVKSVFRLFASCYGAGEISDAIFENLMNFGEHPESELMILQGHLDEQFEDINGRLDEIEKNISSISDKVDASTKEILEGLAGALEAEFAREQFITFTSGADGNFDYTLFKNYLYGSTDPAENPLYYSYAFYNKAKEAENAEVSDEYYNKLYSNLVVPDKNGNSVINLYYQYILSNELSGKESIQRYYYEYLVANEDHLVDKSAEAEALAFTIELYRAALYADDFIEIKSEEFENLIRAEYGPEPDMNAKYVYGDNELTDYVTYGDLLDIEKAIDSRRILLEKQIAKDVAYIFNIAGSYSVAEDGKEFFVMTDNNAELFGSVSVGQTVYLNKFNDEWAETIDLDNSAFSYRWYSEESEIDVGDAAFYVNGTYKSFVGAVYYNDALLYSISFGIDEEKPFEGGCGESWDPYLISNASQFAQINKGLDKHYKLICDVDFGSKALGVIGSEDAPFTGTLDGNGYVLSNLNVGGNDCIGIFGCNAGVIKNLTVDSCTLYHNSEGADKVYGGVVAAKNLGEIYNCEVRSTNINLTQNYSETNKITYAYVAGIAGMNVGSIRYCAVKNTEISLYVLHSYGNSSDISNATYAYVSGISAAAIQGSTIELCAVTADTKLSVVARAECSDSYSTRHPYVNAAAAGISANVANNVNLEKLYSDVTIVTCETERKNISPTGVSDGNNCKETHGKYFAQTKPETEERVKLSSISEIDFPKKRVYHELSYVYSGELNNEYDCYEGELYDINEALFREDGLGFVFDGKSPEDWVIISYYFLDTLNSDLENAKESKVTLLVSVICDGESVLRILEVPIVVKKNEVSALEIIELPTKLSFSKDESVDENALSGGKFYLR